MDALVNRVPFFFPSLGKIAAAVGLLATMVLLACGGDATSTPRPAVTNTPQPTSAAATTLQPTVGDLAGGSPEAFAAAFKKAAAGSEFRATSEFAAAAQPLAEGEKLKIGFIFVGSQKDLGYNQAAAEGSQYLECTGSRSPRDFSTGQTQTR